MVLIDNILIFLSTMLEAVGSADFFEHMAIVFSVTLLLTGIGIYYRGWKQSITDKMISGSFATMGVYAINLLFIPAVYYTTEWVQAGYDLLAIPRIPNEFWSEIPFWIAGIIAIMAHDFADYWNHRFMHQRWLWPIHAIHHSDQHVNGLTTFRVHFLEALFMDISYIVLLAWAGFSPEAAAFGATLLAIHNVYVHADLDWNHGPFKLLVASPRFHRWHHADEPKAYGKNLANVMPIYDYIFGTYYDPHPCRAKMGAKEVPHADVVKLMLFPFAEWYKMIRNLFIAKRETKKNKPPMPSEKPLHDQV